MRIGIDIMGGDFAPESTIIGSIRARECLEEENQIVLFGDKKIIVRLLAENNAKSSDFEIVDCSQVIGMGENPAKSYYNKPDSSIVKGFQYLKNNQIDGFASIGNTGAMMVGAMHVVKSIPGVIRPAIATAMPKLDGGKMILLDVGVNPDPRPDVLYQYGILGSIYAKEIYGFENPKVCLLNIGIEDNKGNLLTKSTFELMKDNPDFNFSGNIEANAIFSSNTTDVVVCDGFVGNILLKHAEAFYHVSKVRNIKDEFVDKLNFVQYGGIPVLGINSVVVIGHGVSNAEAIKNLIVQTKNFIHSMITEKIKEFFK